MSQPLIYSNSCCDRLSGWFLTTFFLLNRKMLQSLGRPEVHMALDVVLVRGSGQEHEGCLLLTSEVLFVVSISEDTQQQAFPITEIDCAQDTKQNNLLTVQLKQPRVACDVEVQFKGGMTGLAFRELRYNMIPVLRHPGGLGETGRIVVKVGIAEGTKKAPPTCASEPFREENSTLDELATGFWQCLHRMGLRYSI